MKASRRMRGGSTLKESVQLIDTLLFFDDNHCRESYESELERNQLPPSMREKRGESDA